MYPWLQPVWQEWLAQTMQSQSGGQDYGIGHAYLLAGTQGIGISDFARHLSQGLLCQQQNRQSVLEPCGQCTQCHQFSQQTHPDFFQVSVPEDKKEISVDQIRQLTDKIYSTSHQGGYKVALIEAVEYLNRSAFNALLKTLEEPPARTVLLLTTYHVGRLPATIVSRCRQIRFSTPSFDQAYEWLAKSLPQADDALLKKALKINWGTPLNAKQWIENKGFELEAEWQSDMKAIRSGKLAVSQVVEKWLKFEQPEQVFDWFYLWTVNAIRSASYNNALPFNPNWVVFQKWVLQAKQTWHHNANKELLLESLCLAWLSHQQPDFNANQPLFSVMKGDLIRGDWV